MTSVADLLGRYARQLDAAGIDSARLDAQLLLGHAMGQNRTALLLHAAHDVPEAVGATADAYIARRLRHEPVAYILGEQEFWSLPFAVTPDVLIPRPDSETLVEQALFSTPRDARGRVLDLGTGSGCLLLAVLHERPGLTGLGVDASPAALAVAAGNAQALGLDDRARWRLGDWADGLDERFDLIVGNPPYIATDEVLMPDVANFEPALALFAGKDGLDAYRRILPVLAALLAPEGRAFLEIGHTQARAVQQLAQLAGLESELARDLAGRDRVVILKPF